MNTLDASAVVSSVQGMDALWSVSNIDYEAIPDPPRALPEVPESRVE